MLWVLNDCMYTEGGGLCYCPLGAYKPDGKPTQGAVLCHGQDARSGRVTIDRKRQYRYNLFYAITKSFFLLFVFMSGTPNSSPGSLPCMSPRGMLRQSFSALWAVSSPI